MDLQEANKPVVLVVEDEFLIRYSASESLESAGFSVVEAANVSEALSILEVILPH
jgi:CheY-like chemotaxis protein